MGKIDEVKEDLNFLRTVFSLLFGSILVMIGGLVARFDALKVDAVFWSGFLLTFLFLVVLFLVYLKIKNLTSSLKDL